MQFLKKQVIGLVRKREKERKYKCGVNVCVCVVVRCSNCETDSDKLRSQEARLWKHIPELKRMTEEGVDK